MCMHSLPPFLVRASSAQGLSMYEVEMALEDDLRALVGWAIYTFVALVEVRPRRSALQLRIRQSHPLPLAISPTGAQRSRGGVLPINSLHQVMRCMLHDSKLRQRALLASTFRQVLAPGIRTKALALPAVQEVFASSVASGAGNFVVVPPPAAGSTSLPTAASLSKAKRSEIADEVSPSRLVDVFVDTDWLLDEVIHEVVDAAVGEMVAEREEAMLARLDKLPGKLGFAAGL